MLPSNTNADDHCNACPQVIFSNTSVDKVPPLPQHDSNDHGSASNLLWLTDLPPCSLEYYAGLCVRFKHYFYIPLHFLHEFLKFLQKSKHKAGMKFWIVEIPGVTSGSSSLQAASLLFLHDAQPRPEVFLSQGCENGREQDTSLPNPSSKAPL